MDAQAPSAPNGMFNGLPDAGANSGFLDPSVFTQQTNGADIGHLQDLQMQQRMPNGNGIRTASPAYQQQQGYNVNPVVPMKRPRPSDDSVGASPRQTPSNPNLSRSQTPQQMMFPGGYPPQQQPGQGQQQQQQQQSAPQQQQGGPPMQAPMPYQHLQQGGSANATPSPTMSNQQYPPPPTPRRMQTQSPTAFAGQQQQQQQPQQQQQQPNMSPQMDPSGRQPTPQHAGMNQVAQMGFMPGASMPPGYNPNFSPMPGMSPGPQQSGMTPQSVPLSQNLQQRQHEANRRYQLQLMQSQAQMRGQGGPMNSPMGAGSPGPVGPNAARQPAQQMPMGGVRGAVNQDTFLKTVKNFNRANGHPFNPNPTVAGRPISLLTLFMSITKAGGTRQVSMTGQWLNMALQFGYPPQQAPMAAQELQMAYDQILAPYEVAVSQSRMPSGKPGGAQQPQVGPAQGRQMSPTKAMTPMSKMQQPPSTPQPTPAQSTPQQSHAALPGTNGWTTPQGDNAGARQGNTFSPSRKSSGHPGFPMASPNAAAGMQGNALSMDDGSQTNGIQPFDHGHQFSTEYVPNVRSLELHGGIDPVKLGELGFNLEKLKPTMPEIEEMGVIDMRSLSMGIQSGIHSEVRLALDYLVKLSNGRQQIELHRCEDLFEIMIDCADDQVRTLANGSAECLGLLDMTPYEDVMRNCQLEIKMLQNIAPFGSKEWVLDRSADRLIAITTILRNLSFFEVNHDALASATMINFLSATIRQLQTRKNLLRTHCNTQEFMKDIVIFLSNVADKILLPNRRAALSILHFLLAFAPTPAPSLPVRFSSFNPVTHRYLPPAIDALAKLIARDDPNRAIYKRLFDADGAASARRKRSSSDSDTTLPPYNLLTRTFALAISVVPERSRIPLGGHMDQRIADARRPYLTQGMLAAEILASLAPGPETGVARGWLEASDGWAPSLIRLVLVLLASHTPAPPPPPPTGRGSRAYQAPVEEDKGFTSITTRALSMLKKLGERSNWPSEDSEDDDEPPSFVADTVNGVDPVDSADTGEANGVTEHGASSHNALPSEDKAGSTAWKAVLQNLIPSPETVLGALAAANVDAVSLNHLCALAALDG